MMRRDEMIDRFRAELCTQLLLRIEGRIALNRKTVEIHPDESARREASTRVEAYATVIDDIRRIIGAV